MPSTVPRGRRRGAASPMFLLALASLVGAALLPFGAARVRGDVLPQHLVISEVVTGGAAASDELIELYNPTAQPLPLEGLELVYVSASGLSVSRRAAWSAEAAEIPPGHHLLVAHELGVYASVADALYASGMAATGGSVALRIQGASAAIDAVGWGTAASPWMEGQAVPAPAAGSSLERLPGGAAGSTQDTDDNLTDFVERLVPDPQNTGSAPTPDPTGPTPDPSAMPTSTPVPATPAPSATAAPTPIPTPGLTIVSVATARALPNGTSVTIEATALTGSDFADGGGYVADASGGIAVLMSSGTYERGSLLRITGTLDDRFSQRTLRSSEAQVGVLGAGTQPTPGTRATGAIGESVEGSLVRITGTVAGAPTTLSAGLAYDVDDGSGVARVVVASHTGIETAGWSRGATVDLVGVVGQRDSSGSGTAGYRVQPRDAADVVSVGQPSPSPSGSGGASPTPGVSTAPDGVSTIADARAAPKNARVTIRGVVTMAPGLVDPISAVVQDPTGAILLRIGEEVGEVVRGERIKVDGVRSTLAGMETLRVTSPATRLGAAGEPEPAVTRTGDAGEALEARLVRARGAVVATARRVASGTVSFEIDDGSGPLRVYVAAPIGADSSGLLAGAWVEVTGVLGQETTGALPLRGYRIWPRSADEVRIGATPTAHASDAPGSDAGGGSSGTRAAAQPVASLEAIGAPGTSSVRIGATLVAGPWPELDLGGLLWDGTRLVGLDASSSEAVRALLAASRPPLPLALDGLRSIGTHAALGVPLAALDDPAAVAVGAGPPAAPYARLVQDGRPRWISVVGVLRAGAEPALLVDGVEARVVRRCQAEREIRSGTVSVTGIGLAAPRRVLVGCDGIRPVPGLGSGGRPVPLGTGGAASIAADAGAAAAGQVNAPGAPAAALLVGAAALLGGAAMYRRLRPDPDGATSDGAAGIDDVPGGDEDDPALPARLTLVGTPHEGASR